MKFQARRLPSTHIHIHIYRQKIVIEKGSLEMKSRTRSENETNREREREKKKTSWEKQQIVVLKMWEKCKNVHFGLFYCTCKTHIYNFTSPPSHSNSPRTTSSFAPFRHLYSTSVLLCKRGNCKFPSCLHAARSWVGLHGFCRLTIAFCSTETASGYYVGWIIQISFWVNVMRATFDNGSPFFFSFSHFFFIWYSVQLKNGKQKIYESVAHKKYATEKLNWRKKAKWTSGIAGRTTTHTTNKRMLSK